MRKDTQMTAQPQGSEADGTGKRAYVKPEFRHEAVFETMALACGKVDPVLQQCIDVPSAS